MKKRDAQRERVIEALAAHFLANGLGDTGLRSLAAAAGISDRMLLYYFRDKADVMACVIGRLAGGFAAALDAALSPDPLPPERLLLVASDLVLSPAMRPSMRLWLQIAAAASRQESPFPAIAKQIVEQFIAWLDARIDRPAGPERRRQAALLLAVIDGVSLVDMAGGGELTTEARAALVDVKFM
jgi:AcrR family transcriptional regulator